MSSTFSSFLLPFTVSRSLPPADSLFRSSLCLVCHFPAEFCEFGSSLSRCKAWLEESHPKLFDQWYSEGESKLTIMA